MNVSRFSSADGSLPANGSLSPTAQATLLLTSYFSKASSESAKPLTNAEWGRFALWLKEKSTTPADLLVSDPKALLQGWHDARISAERIIELLSRGHSLALTMEKWQRAGSGGHPFRPGISKAFKAAAKNRFPASAVWLW